MHGKDIKACPFCGGKEVEVSVKTVFPGTGNKYKICTYCKSCYCYGPRFILDDERERDKIAIDIDVISKALTRWNRRV